MKDEIFADLLASAEEMIAIEKGQKVPAAGAVQHFETLDVKAIREAAGKDRQAFASIIGVSYESVKSWETRRRNPSGAAKRLLTLISVNPSGMVELLEAARGTRVQG
jgi:putative transcriptional regulator